MDSNKYKINIEYEKYIEIRHDFHKIPELAYEEHKTIEKILAHLNEHSYFTQYAKITRVGETGLFFDVTGLAPSTSENQIISFRADIDALPLNEETGLSYSSQNQGRAHSCGHDGHITIMLATIDYYLSNLEKIPSSFTARFLFQPAEEGRAGALRMIEGGCLQNVDEIYGLHNVTTFNVGEIGIIEGCIMAGITIFEINIKGKGGHSSTPNKCISPITIGAQLINMLNQITAQEVDSKDRCVLALGTFQAGQTYNVIPESGVVKGTFRTLSKDVRELICSRIQTICNNLSGLYGAEIVPNFEKNSGIETVNTKVQTHLITKIAQKYFKVATHDLPLMASEDFSFYLNKTPGCFFMLGCKDTEHIQYLHTPNYDFNDKSLPIGVEMFIRIVEDKTGVKLI